MRAKPSLIAGWCWCDRPLLCWPWNRCPRAASSGQPQNQLLVAGTAQTRGALANQHRGQVRRLWGASPFHLFEGEGIGRQRDFGEQKPCANVANVQGHNGEREQKPGAGAGAEACGWPLQDPLKTRGLWGQSANPLKTRFFFVTGHLSCRN